MKVLFGPVASRRLGRSLGLDLLPPKTCTFDCIYCELGPTTHRTVEPVCRIEPDQVLEELAAYLKTHPGQVDCLTISGSGEPTLYPHLGTLIGEMKRRFALPVALITNSSLLFRPAVLEGVRAADIIIPSLDAVDAETLATVNRPHPDLSLDSILEGLRALGRLKGPRIWLEVLFIAGLNDRPVQLDRLKEIAAELRPERLQINTVVRPPVEASARPLTEERLEAIREALGDRAEVIGRPAFRNALLRWREDEILTMLSRRPCTADELSRLTGLSSGETLTWLEHLAGQEKIACEEFDRIRFYRKRASKSDRGGC